MSADVLRQAAALMRERAESATPGPWGTTWDNQVVAAYGSPDDGEQLADCFDGDALATHIASWHPAVALAVAAWLDSTANDVEHVHTAVYNLTSTTVARALAVARVYLGESA